ncbi:peptidoglycan recognition family protein [Pontibacter sp. BT731]|nr:peptidoglycan recognition family protein [Pontibacter sp. BT731]MDO6392116.1 peptidoglycan recognition family protein [Pontibacter sp. BT731]
MRFNSGQLRNIALRCAVLGLLLCSACASPTFRTHYKPVVFDAERKKLSLEYMEKRHGLVQDSPYIKPKMIVLHWTAIPTLEQSFDAMNPVHLPGSRSNLGAVSALNVSAQFLVDRDGTIFQQLPDTAFARHVIGLNHSAIGVENVGSAKSPLTKAQLKANEELIRYLTKRYGIEYLIGHYEYKLFIGHELWKESDPNYLTEKTDPGESFMQKIRKRTKDLELKGPPAR